MIKKLKNIFIVGSLLGVLLAPALVPAAAFAQANIAGSLCSGSDLTYGTNGGNCGATAGQSQVNKILTLVINLFSLIVGAVSVIMIIVGGLKYITSGGESNNITSAKNTIVFAIVGLVIVALAQFIVHFVLGHAVAASR